MSIALSHLANNKKNEETALPTRKEMLQNFKQELDKLASMEGGTKKPILQSSTIAKSPPSILANHWQEPSILVNPWQEPQGVSTGREALQPLKKEDKPASVESDTEKPVPQSSTIAKSPIPKNPKQELNKLPLILANPCQEPQGASTKWEPLQTLKKEMDKLALLKGTTNSESLSLQSNTESPSS